MDQNLKLLLFFSLLIKRKEKINKRVKKEEGADDEDYSPAKKQKKKVKKEEDETSTSKVKKEDTIVADEAKSNKDAGKEEDAPVETEEVKNGDKKKVKKTMKKESKRYCFEERFEQCKGFLEQHGHCKIPTAYKENKGLGIWVQETRRNFKLKMTTGKPRKDITPEQIEQLNSIDFYWGYKPKAGAPQSDEMWEKTYLEVQEYHEKHGTFDIPLESGGFLAEWVRVQRDQKKRRDSKMKCNINAQRIKMLNSIKFNWDGPRKLPEDTK